MGLRILGQIVPATPKNLEDPRSWWDIRSVEICVECANGVWGVRDSTGVDMVFIPCGSKEEAINLAETTYELSN